MNPRNVRLFDRISRIVAGSRSLRTRARTIVLGDQPRHRDTGVFVEQWQHRLPDCAADILEIHVAPGRKSRGQSSWKIGRAVIDRGIEAKHVLHKSTFLGATGDADGPRTGELRQLADQRAHGSARCGDDHGLTGLRLADRARARISGEAWHAEHAEAGRHRRNGRIELAKGGTVKAYAVRERMRAPSRYCDDDVAFRITGML